MSKIIQSIKKLIIRNDIKKLAFFWFFCSIAGGILCINLIGFKGITGTYEPKQIDMDNSIIEIVGRPYDKSMMIFYGNDTYESICIDEYHHICEKYFNKSSIVFEKLKFIEMEDKKGFIIYSEFKDKLSKQEIKIDNTSKKYILEEKYAKKFSNLIFIFIIPFVFSMFFMTLLFFKPKN